MTNLIEALKSLVAEDVKASTRSAVALGDLILEIKSLAPTWSLAKIAREVGLSKGRCQQRAYIASRFSKGHWMRETSLTFSHVRTLARIIDDEVCRRLHDEALETGFTASRLTLEIRSPRYENSRSGRPPRRCALELCGSWARKPISCQYSNNRGYFHSWDCAEVFCNRRSMVSSSRLQKPILIQHGGDRYEFRSWDRAEYFCNQRAVESRPHLPPMVQSIAPGESRRSLQPVRYGPAVLPHA
jgi:hypothetical protein